MSKPDRSPAPDLTEEQWLALTEPLRMPKLFGRVSARKRCLLACAYALSAPGAFKTEPARRVITAIQAAAMALPSASGLTSATRLAVVRHFPESANALYGLQWSTIANSAQFAGEGWRFTCFLRECAYALPSPAIVNTIATTCVSTVGRAAEAEVRPTYDGIIAKHKRVVTDALKEELFALIPEPEQTRIRSKPWQFNHVPARVRNKVYAAASRPRMRAASAALADIVREVYGNPFRKPKIEPEWLLWNHGAVRLIAEQIATSGNFADMPILADALEDAGCIDEYLLRHCREERVHVPGCWVLDAVLGRE